MKKFKIFNYKDKEKLQCLVINLIAGLHGGNFKMLLKDIKEYLEIRRYTSCIDESPQYSKDTINTVKYNQNASKRTCRIK